MPATVLSAFHILTYFILTAALSGKYYYYPHFTNKEAKAHSQLSGKAGIQIQSDSRICVLKHCTIMVTS